MSAVANVSINACAKALIAIIVGVLFSGTTFAQTTYTEGGTDWASTGDGDTYTISSAGTYNWTGVITSPGDLQDRFSIFVNSGFQIASASITISGPGGFSGSYGFYANSAAIGLGTTAMSSGIGFPMGGGILYNGIYAGCGFSAGNTWLISVVVTCAAPGVSTSMSPSGTLCIGSSATVTASGATTYTWAPSTGLSATTGSTVTASPTTTTTYTITGTSGGCTGTTTRTITVSSTIPTVTTTVSPTGNICAGSSKTITASGATTYAWTPATGLSATTGATVTASPTTTTTYTVTGTTSGCSDQATRSVTVLAAPTVTISASPSASMCVGDSRTLTASGATSYTWTPATSLSATTGATVVCTSTVTRTYTITGTGSNGCTKQVTQTVTVNTIPTVATSMSPTGNLCMGSSKTLTASGATTYSWAPATGLSATTGSTVTASPYSTTTYTVTGANGVCTNVATRTINIINPPNITSTSALLGIPGSNITITGTGFNGTNANNIVYFGATRATVTGSSTTSLVATVPTGAIHKLITLNNQNCDLTGYSQYPFLPTYNNSAYAPSTVNFATKVGVSVSGPADGMALGDIDGDGKVDLVVVAGYVCVCRNTSSSGSITAGSFDTPVLFDAGSATRVAISDIDGDGKPDLIVTSMSENTVKVLRNTSSSGSITSGSFDAAVPFAAGSYPYEIAIGDIDDDGKPDITVTNSFSTTISVLRNTSSSGSISSGSFATLVTFTVGSQPKGIAIGDLDGDGRADLAVANGSSNTISVLRNTSSSGSITSGSFATQVTFATGGNPSDLTIGDIDGDGKPDLVVGNYTSNTVSVLRNTSSSGSITSGSFATQVQFATVSLPFKIDIGDIDGDGKPDLVASSYHNTASVLRNNSSSGSITSGSFDAQVTFNVGSDPYDIAIGDIDGDGKSDMVVANYVYSGSQIYVLRNNPLASITGAATVCAGTTTTLSNAASGGTWSSSNTAIATVGSSTGVVTGVAAGTVTITYAGTAGASFAGNRVTTTVTVNALPTVATSVSPTGAICVGSSKAITASGASTYTWTPATGLSATTGATVTASPTTTTIYTVTGTASTGCTDQATRNVSVNALPTVTTTTSPSGPICRGDSKTLTASGASTYTWAPATGLSATTGTSVTASPTTTVTYTITGTDANGCVDQATRQVSVNALPTATIAMSPTGNLCTGNSKTLTASGASTYTWAPATDLSATTGSVVTASPTVATTYTVTGTDANGCSDEATRTITVIATPTVTTTVSPTGSICLGSSKTITASGATTYTWAPATGLSATTGAAVTASPTVTTSYTVTGTTSGCSDQATRGVTVIAVPTVTASASPSGAICRGDAQTLTASGAVSYTWTPATGLSATTGASVTASPTTTVTYTITGTASNGCTDQVTQQVTVNALPTVTNTMTPTGALCMGSSKTVNASGAVSYSWAPATGLSATTGSSVTATPYSTTTYTITGTNAAGCTDESTRTITVTAPPEITATSAVLGIPGTAITITGTGFNATNANNIVYFGATRATVTGSTSTSLTATVPVGATYMPITLNNQNCDLVGYSQYPFLPTYNNSTYVPSTVNFNAKTDFTTGSGPFSVAIGDIDGDGKPDMAVANFDSNTVSVYRNTSSIGGITSGSFASQVTFATGSNPHSLAIGDIDGDGKLDLAVTNWGSNTVSVYRNTSSTGSITSGSFASQVTFATGSYPHSIAIGDIDGDGKPDLAVANFYSNTVSVYRNTSSSGTITSGSFASQVTFATSVNPFGVTIGDIDGDGKLDLGVTNWGSNTVSVYRNTSNTGSITSGSFAAQVTFATGSHPYGVAMGDIDGDGKPDLVTANSNSKSVSVLRNTSSSGSITSGSFAARVDFAIGSNLFYVAIGDMDGDGKADLATANYDSNSVSVLRNTSSSGSIIASSFATRVNFGTATHPRYVAIGDMDGDSKPDILVANTGANSVSVLRNNPLSPITGTASVCSGSTTTLSNATSGGTWSSSNTAIATVGSTTGVVTGVASGTVTITYAGTAGASFAGNRVTTIVTVLATPTVTTSASPGGGICIGSSQAITASGATTYTWAPATGLSATTGATVTASPTITTTYTITGTTSGCADQANQVVTINALPTISAGATVTICRLSSTTLTATGGSTYTWSPATGLSATTGATVTASPTTTVTYTITGTDANGCSKTVTKMVSVNALPTISAGAGITICSGNSTSMTATGGTTYTWAPNTALSATTGATVTASPTSTITYTVTGTNANGCSNTATKTVSVNTTPTITAGSNVTVCRGTSTSLTASGGTTYTWTPNTALSATTGSSVTATPTTTVTYTVTGTTSGCTSTATQTVSVNPLPTISAGGTVTICRFSSTTLTATGGSTYTWSPGTGLSATTGASVTASPTTTVTYTVTGTDANSCVNTATKIVSVNATIPTITATMSPTGNLCMGSSKTLTAAGGTTYTWAPATGLSATTGTSVTASPYSDITYTVTGTTSACSNTATVSITLTNPPAITSASAIAGIPGTAITITGTGFNATNANNIVYFGATRATVTGSSTTSLTATVPLGATYAPITLNNQNCDLTDYAQYPFLPTYNNSAFSSATVNFDARSVFTAGSFPTDVAIGDLDGDGKADLAVANEGSDSIYVYRNISSSGSITSGSFATPVPFVTSGDPHDIAIGDLDGDGKADLAVANFGTNTISVYRNTSSSGSITSGSFATQVTFSTGVNPFVVAIGDMDGDGRADLVVSLVNVDLVSVLRNKGSSGSITSSSFAAGVTFATGIRPSAVAISDIDGDGKPDVVTANSNSNSVSVLRNTSSTGSFTSGSLATHVTFATGDSPLGLAMGDLDGDGKADLAVINQGSSSINVYRNTSSSGTITTASFATPATFSTGAFPNEVAIADIDGDGKPDLAVPDYGSGTVSIYRNTSSSGSITSGSFAARVAFASGSSTYGFAAGDMDGDGKADLVVANTEASTVSVLRNNPLSPISGATGVCIGATTTLSNTASGGTWSSSNAAIASVGSSTGVVAGVAAGTVTITYGGTAGASFAGNRVTMVMTVNTPPTTTAGSDVTVCSGSSTALTASGGTTYTWTPNTALSATTGASVTASPTTTVTYTVTGTTNGCSSTATQTVSVNALPTISAGATVAMCAGNSTSLTATGGDTYTWSPAIALDATTGASVTASPTTTVTYTITGTDANGCVDTATKMVSVNALPTISAGVGVAICSGNSTSMTATGGTTYTWSPGTDLSATTGATVTASPTTTVTYTVTGTNANGCVNTAIKTVSVNVLPTIDAGTGANLCQGSSTTLTGTGGSSYTWTPGTGLSATTGTSVTASPTVTTTYTLTGTDANGCVNTGTKTLTILNRPIITSASPMIGIPGNSVTVTGSGFNSTDTNNIVFFGATRATITGSSTTSLTATVPTGATYMPITLNNQNCGLVGYSEYPYLPTYDNSPFVSATVNLNTRVTFSYSQPPQAISLADLDGDGKIDMVVTSNLGASVYRNAGSSGSITSGSFAAPVSFGGGGVSGRISIGDINGDGKPDIAVVKASANTFAVLRNTSSSGSITSGSFRTPVSFATANPRGLAIGDIDGDGKPDIAVANGPSNTVSVFRNTSSDTSITFATQVTFATGAAPQRVDIGDIDGDGKPDLVVANISSNNVSVFRNTSNSGSITLATQVTFATGTSPQDVMIGDIDGDGKPDLAIPNYSSNTVSVLRNTSSSGSITSGSFATQVAFATGAGPYGIEIGDMDGDGKPDLVTVNKLSNTVSLLRNTSSSGSITSGSFGAHVPFATGAGPIDLAIGDIDGDGKSDLAVADNFSLPSFTTSVLRNNPLSPVTGTTVLCQGMTTTLASATTGGSWSSSNTAVATVGATGIVTGISGGTAAITYAGTAGASFVDNRIVTVVTVNGISAGANGAICSGASTTLTASGATTYTWSPGTDLSATTGSIVTASPTMTTTYTVTSTTSGCMATQTVSVNAVPTISVGADVAICSSSSTTLTATGGSTYTWSPGTGLTATTGASVTASPTTTVTYTVTGTDVNGCTSTATQTVSVNALPTISAGATVTICRLSSATLTATGGDTYTWSPATALDATTGAIVTASPTTTVTYTVTGTDANGCSKTATKMVSVNALPAISAGVGVAICSGNSTSMTATGGTTYTWSPGADLSATTGATVTASPTTTVTYTVTGTNAIGCSNTATKTVTVIALPTVSGGADVAICYGSSTVLSASGATAYTWSPGTGLSATTGASVTAANTVTTTYTITGTSSGCSGTAAVTVTVNPLSDPGTITGASAVTVGSVLTLSNVVTGGVWSSSDTAVASVDSTGSVTGISAGTVTISYITTNGCGSVSTTKTITVNALLETGITGTFTVCTGVTTALSNATAGGVWSSANEGVASVGSASGIVTGVSAGTSTITYALPGSYVTAVVSVYAMPAVITGAGSVCTNTPITLACATTGGAWSCSNTTIATVDSTGTVTGLVAGSANISYTTSGGCRSTKTITINVSPSAISGSMNGCIGATNTFTCTPTGGAWVSGTTSVATINSFGQATGFAGGVSAISYILSSGCLATGTLTINALPDSVSGTAVVCAGLTTALTGYPSGGTWTSGNTAVATVGSSAGVVSGLLLGTARITYTNANGCYKIKIVTVNAAPLAITGTAAVCVGNTTTLACPGGGTWVSSNTAVGTIGTSGIVGGVSGGITTITYRLYTGCSRTIDVTVNTAPAAIAGTANMCVGTTTTLSSTPSGGTWSSSGITVGTVGSTTGVVTGISGGAVTISYTIAGGCRAIRVVTVNNNPPSIGGTATLITGGTTTLTNVMTGGAWSSGATGIATVGSTGVVFGAGPGTAVISYTSAAGCAATKTVTVSGTTGSITGVTTLCVGSTTSLSCFPSGGTWTSANTAVATVTSTGLVTGVSVGTATISYDLSGTTVSTIVTVYAMPGTVTGTAVLCASGGTTTLSCTPGGGAWSTTAVTVATVGSTTGLVTGVSSGTAVITYSTGVGCYTTREVTVNAAPAAITGTANVCPAATTTLSNVTVGGTWSSSATGTATVNSSGVVTGVAPGMATISYHLGSCAATKVVTVNSLPGTIGSTSVLCSGIVDTLTVTPSGGSWSSSNTAVGTINSITGVFAGLTGGTTTVTYLLATGCRSETILTVNESPAAISGPTTVCPGIAITLVSATSGGTWSSSDTAVASISTSGVVTGLTYGTANISYTTGSCSAVKVVTVNTAFTSGLTYNICQGGTKTLVDSLPGGTWSSSNPSVATVVSGTGVATAISAGMTTITYYFGGTCSKTTPLYVQNSTTVISGPSTVCEGLTSTMSVPLTSSGGAWTSSNTSVASINLSTGVLSAVSAGVATISYTEIECVATMVVTINPVPAVITGAQFACTGLTTTLANATGGGSWTSSSASVATVGSATGIVSGLTTGTSNISYTIPNGCRRTAIVTIAATPASITGTASVCVGNTTTLASVSPGGTWSSSNSAVASASGTAGIVSGIAAGNATITYGFGGTCISTRVVTVNAAPGAITGPNEVCAGQNITFVNTLTPGTWSSGAPGIATANSSTGLIAGVSAGTATITYTTSVGACKVTKVVTVNAALPAITGGNTVCVGDAVTLATTASGGTWSSSVVAKATVGSATGVVTGVATGTTTITYMVSIGCYKTSLMVVNPIPAAISGASSVVAGSSTSLSCATSGGAWSSSNIAVGTVGSASGWVTGVSAGTTTISYTIITTGCRSLKAMTVNPTTLSRGVAGVDNTDGLVFAVFPNPTQGAITVETSTAGVFTIYTIDGRLMSEHKIETSSAYIRLPDDIASGIYLCKFTRDNGSVETVRLIYTGQ